MGTSQSSPGSPSNVPMVPPWVPDASVDGGNDQNDPDQADNDAGAGDTQQPVPLTKRPVPIAPRGRFGPARRDIGSFGRTGSTDDMRRGVGHYARKGLGGGRTAAARFGGTAQTAGTLYGALSALSSGQAAPGSPLDPALLQGRSADEVMDAVVETVRPVDGSQDAEASRYAINDALSDVLTRFPEADLLNLSEEQRLFAIERYIALDVFERFDLDVGKHLRENASSVAVELSRFREVKTYIHETVAASFRKSLAASQALDSRRINNIVRSALQEAFEIFEGYLS